MAVTVVDALEEVDVEDHERQRTIAPLGARELACQRLVEQSAVGEAGERVARGEPLDVGQQPRVPQRERGVRRRPGE